MPKKKLTIKLKKKKKPSLKIKMKKLHPPKKSVMPTGKRLAKKKTTKKKNKTKKS